MHYTSPEVYEFISKQTKDPIVERKTCRVSGIKFPIYQSDLDFYDKMSHTFDGKKFQIPTPTLCPEERQRRRMARRNERFLFKRKCDATGKNIISMYPPTVKFPVYTAETRWSDSRDAQDFGFSFDYTKTFTEQFKVLLDTVPRLFMYNLQSENSDYSNCSSDMKNCYLVTAGVDCENSYYGNYMYHSNDCTDNFMVFDSQRLYECVECMKCESCQYCYNTNNSSSSYFLTNCDTCSFCFGCVNLVRKRYCWFNQQLTKSEYEKRLSTVNLGSYEEMLKIKQFYKKELKKYPISATVNMQTENCVANYSVVESKNCLFSFDIEKLEDCKYSYRFRGGKDCYDVFSRGSRGERIYESVQIGDNVNNLIACQGVDSESSFCFYSTACSASSHLFGCNGMKKASYCIFNKQYTPEAREKEVAKIIFTMKKTGERGEMLSPRISIFGYNYSVATEFEPSTQGEVERLGYFWEEYKSSEIGSTAHIKAINLPDDIKNIDESILSQIISCSETKKLYRITKQEYEFYKNNNIPLPRKHINVRFSARLAKRPGRALFLRNCDKCEKKMVSVYEDNTLDSSIKNSEGQRKVYCEECYQKEVYG